MNRIVLAGALLLFASPVLAQPAPPNQGPPPPPPGGAVRPAPPPAADLPPGAHPASISLRGPHGVIHVHCAQGETTKACADVVADLLARTQAMLGARPETGRQDRDDRDYYEERGRRY